MNNTAKLAKYFKEVLTNEPLSKHTTLAIGGPASIFIKVKLDTELISAINKAKELKVRFLVIGDGSDLLITDKGYDGLVISNEIIGIKATRGKFIVKAGTPLQKLVDLVSEKGYAGLEKMTGIPGSVGGAIYGNAGAYGQTVSDNISRVKAFDGKELKWLTLDECRFNYRESIFKRNKWTILEGVFDFKVKSEAKILKKIKDETLSLRLAKYKPGLKCPGSYFKNILASDLTPEQLAKIPREKIVYGKVPAGYLLEAVGAKGKKRGKILIADYHANLFINTGGGNASDFYKLAQKYADKVEEKFSIRLEPEVQLIGF